jgi:uncharacterized damage-inducible protein DinB
MAAPLPTLKQHLLDRLEREHTTTMRVLGSYPDGKSDFKPHPKSPSARELAWVIAMGHGLSVRAVTEGLDWSKPLATPPAAPSKVSEAAAAYDQQYAKLVEAVRGMDEAELAGTVQFFVSPKTLGDFTKLDFLWFLLMDHVHHRGQFSTYLRMADGHVPSIYGPSGDEPWR